MLINTQALRNKILTLAVQGKLVPQNQADGTAEELFIQIQQEKQPLSGSLNDENHHPNCHCETCQKASRGNLLATENQANDYNDNGIATTATQSCNDGVLTAFDEIAAYNAKITQMKGQRETLLLQIEKQHKSEKNAHRKARLKTLSGSLKNKIKTYRTITPLNQNPEFTPPFDIPKEWAWVKLGEITRNVGNKSNQILAKDINKNGKFPVVSQGQSLIDGYSDQEKCVIYALPLIMFGDHTRKVKFIDFPFVVGADGTKFHKVICGYSKFIYFWMLTTADTLKNRGYARHYSLLTKIPIPLPPLAEQQRIVEKVEQAFAQLDKIDALQAQYQDNLTAFCAKLLKLAIHGELSAKYRRENVTQNSAPTVIASKRCSRGNLLTMESTAFDEIAAHNAKTAKIKAQREKLLAKIDKQLKAEKGTKRKTNTRHSERSEESLNLNETRDSSPTAQNDGNVSSNLKTPEQRTEQLKRISGSLKNKIKTYRTITPLNQNPEFTPPFEIPNSWAWVKLGDLGQVVSGGTPPTSDESNFGGDIAWITPADLTHYDKKYISHGNRKLTEKGYKVSSSQLMPKGSVLFSSRAPIGYVVIASNPVCTNQGFKNIVPFSIVSSEYLYYFLKSAKETAISLAGGTTFKEISAKNFAEIKIPLPPLAEQQFIAGQLEKLLDLCKKLKTKP